MFGMHVEWKENSATFIPLRNALMRLKDNHGVLLPSGGHATLAHEVHSPSCAGSSVEHVNVTFDSELISLYVVLTSSVTEPDFTSILNYFCKFMQVSDPKYSEFVKQKRLILKRNLFHLTVWANASLDKLGVDQGEYKAGEIDDLRSSLMRLSQYQMNALLQALPPSVVRDLHARAVSLQAKGWQV